MNRDKDRVSLERSRPFGVAEGLVGGRVDRDIVLAKRVILTAGEGVLSAVEAQWCMLDSLQLLGRVVGHLKVVLPEDAPPRFAEAVAEAVSSVWSQGNVSLAKADGANWDDATSVLCVHRPHARAADPVVVGSAGWIAYVGTSPLPGGGEKANPIAALMAASIGVTEVFKQVYGVPLEVAPRLIDEYFNLYSLSASDLTQGPNLPPTPSLPDTLLLGAGAIGNAIASLLGRLRPRGRLIIVDKDVFAPENRGTCMLLDLEGWLGQSKAEMLASFLEESGGLSVRGWHGRIEDAIGSKGLGLAEVDLVLGALDDVGARRAVQRLWPAVLVDGAINARGATSIARRFVDDDVACLRCTFPEPPRKITEYSEAERQLYVQRKAICAQLDDATTQKAFGLQLEDGFRPSVPFVASASAALVVAQALKATLWPDKEPGHQVQIESLFFGFSTAQRLRRTPLASCECVRHRDVILKSVVEVRAARRGIPSA
jgi:molybdopterin/thiamine biosynthesis adenylyltransferase